MHAFRTFLIGKQGGTSDLIEDAAVAYLHIQYFVAKIVVQTSPHNNEVIFEHHTRDFEAINKWSEKYILASRDLKANPATKSLDLRVIFPLRNTALYCRDLPSVDKQYISYVSTTAPKVLGAASHCGQRRADHAD